MRPGRFLRTPASCVVASESVRPNPVRAGPRGLSRRTQSQARALLMVWPFWSALLWYKWSCACLFTCVLVCLWRQNGKTSLLVIHGRGFFAVNMAWSSGLSVDDPRVFIPSVLRGLLLLPTLHPTVPDWVLCSPSPGAVLHMVASLVSHKPRFAFPHAVLKVLQTSTLPHTRELPDSFL